ncbi:MAG: hypothetical protein KC994_06330 [Candidatus Omnitrophica bacterium]|nr:hypothetical protein [Candidatus Omnitrophota bacterium]
MRFGWRVIIGALLTLGYPAWSDPGAFEIETRGNLIELRSPFFSFTLNADGPLRAESLKNFSTGKEIVFEDASEFRVTIMGEDGEPQSVTFQSSRFTAHDGELEVWLNATDLALSATIEYEFDGESPVFHKFSEIQNAGEESVRLLDVYLGEYKSDTTVTGRERGFPAYLGDEAFLSIAHPAGWATAEEKHIALVQHPGVKIEPGETFKCMEVVYGVAREGGARNEFLAYVKSRMRRVVRGHDKPYAIFEPFGGMPGGSFDQTEEYLLDNLAKVEAGKDLCDFDLYSVDFWVDYNGDLIQFDPMRYPNGFERIKEGIKRIGAKPGLWIDSSMELWSIGGNPDVISTYTHDSEVKKEKGRTYLCRATEPIKSMYEKAFRYHIRENGVRCLKFDNFWVHCNNPNHGHLPGVYSIEPIVNAQIDFLHAMDDENPDVFLMLYWGHRSPWWLLHADTLFDSGVGIEAAHPSDLPAPYARDSVTQKLDQAQEYAKDIPKLGKDSLGVWLSDWGWNSSIGKERWQEAFVMDICRGSLLAQPWSDTDWLSTPERRQIGEFISLLKARPDCFGNPNSILGNPEEEGPYGYSCTNGERAFLAINNGTWEDSKVPLVLAQEWGLTSGAPWEVYRWYPDPARLDFSGDSKEILLRPFEVVLLEVVPSGAQPSLDRSFDTEVVPSDFAEASRSLDIAVETSEDEDGETQFFRLEGQTPATESGGRLVITVQRFEDSAPKPIKHIWEYFSLNGKLGGASFPSTPIFGELTYPSSWHGWRIPVETSTRERSFEISIKADEPPGLDHSIQAHFLPN